MCVSHRRSARPATRWTSAGGTDAMCATPSASGRSFFTVQYATGAAGRAVRPRPLGTGTTVNLDDVSRERLWASVQRILRKSCWDGVCRMTTAGQSDGYATGSIGRTSFRAHVLLARFFLGPCPEGQEVRHLCGRGKEGCVTPSHLAYGTRKENMQDMVRHGRAGRGRSPGEANPNARLTMQEARQVRAMRKQGWTQQAIADVFRITQSHVSRICRMAAWKED